MQYDKERSIFVLNWASAFFFPFQSWTQVEPNHVKYTHAIRQYEFYSTRENDTTKKLKIYHMKKKKNPNYKFLVWINDAIDKGEH